MRRCLFQFVVKVIGALIGRLTYELVKEYVKRQKRRAA